MESKYGLFSPGSSGWTSLKNEEFQEEDVWGAFQEEHDSYSRDRKPSYMSKGLQSPARPIPNPNKKSYSLKPKIIQHRSAPLSIPDWSKIYGTGSSNTYNNSCFWLDPDSNIDKNNRGFVRNRWHSDIEEEDYDDGEMEKESVIPPHEWIAYNIRPSFSVCEGAGRTLKGRDLLSVRNAVLTKTGFLESNPTIGSPLSSDMV